MNRLLIVAAASLALMLSCGGNRTEQHSEAPADTVETTSADTSESSEQEQLITEAPLPQAADELFDDFLFNFVANRRLQFERIQFPLPVTRNGQTTPVTAEEWKMERFFMRQGFYTLLFGSQTDKALMNDTSLTEATVEKIYFNTHAVIQYAFHRLRGTWMLTAVDTQPIAANSNASFLDFYHHFATDSAFQCHSLAETVDFVGPDPDDDFSQMEGFLTADTWPAFAPELPTKMIYNIVYGPRKPSTGRMVLLVRGIANGMELEMTFRQDNGGHWKLTKLTT